MIYNCTSGIKRSFLGRLFGVVRYKNASQALEAVKKEKTAIEKSVNEERLQAIKTTMDIADSVVFNRELKNKQQAAEIGYLKNRINEMKKRLSRALATRVCAQQLPSGHVIENAFSWGGTRFTRELTLNQSPIFLIAETANGKRMEAIVNPINKRVISRRFYKEDGTMTEKFWEYPFTLKFELESLKKDKAFPIGRETISKKNLYGHESYVKVRRYSDESRVITTGTDGCIESIKRFDREDRLIESVVKTVNGEIIRTRNTPLGEVAERVSKNGDIIFSKTDNRGKKFNIRLILEKAGIKILKAD